MANKSKQGLICSLRVDRDFLQKLGRVLEREVNERATSATTKERPWTSVTYSIATKRERLTFERMEELLDTTLLPSNIESFSARVYHHDRRFVDISFTLEEPEFRGLQSYEASSDNQPALLKVVDDLEKLFANAAHGYHATFRRGAHPKLLSRLVAGLVALAVGYFVFTAFPKEMDKDSIGAAFSLSVYAAIGGFLLAATVLRWAYPIYEFSIGGTEPARHQARFAVWTVFSGIVFGALVKHLSGILGL